MKDYQMYYIAIFCLIGDEIDGLMAVVVAIIMFVGLMVSRNE